MMMMMMMMMTMDSTVDTTDLWITAEFVRERWDRSLMHKHDCSCHRWIRNLAIADDRSSVEHACLGVTVYGGAQSDTCFLNEDRQHDMSAVRFSSSLGGKSQALMFVFSSWWCGSVIRASVSDWRSFPDMCLIYGTVCCWRVTTSWVRRPLWVNQPGQLSLLPSVGRGISSIAVSGWMKLLAAVSPSSECLYEGKADVVYCHVNLCDPHMSA